MDASEKATHRIDVSYIVNVHSGHKYLGRTMASIEEAATVAKAQGLRTELLFVLDRSPLETAAWVKQYRSAAFAVLNTREVDNGSLGLSRQAGLEAAIGEYFQFCDEDDLISSNTTVESHRLAKRQGSRTIVIPEFLLIFGSSHLLAHYNDSAIVPTLSFLAQHPFTSRLFAHRSIKDLVRFQNVPLSSGYAYEDWLYNATAILYGFRFEVARDTVIYYRQHEKSLLRAMNSTSVRLPPPCALYQPENFIEVCSDSVLRLKRDGPPLYDANEICNRFRTSEVLVRSVIDSNRIEPAIAPIDPTDNRFWSNLSGDFLLGLAYFQACKLVNSDFFTDVVLAHTLGSTRSDRQALLTASMNSDEIGSRVLVLLDCSSLDTTQKESVVASIKVIDLRSLEFGLSDDQIDIISLRLIEVCASKARIHLSACDYAYRFGRRFAKLLNMAKFAFHRSPDHKGRAFLPEACEEFNFVSELCDEMNAIVCNSQELIDTTRGALTVNIANGCSKQILFPLGLPDE